jgi:hypothetical protein
MIPMLKNVLNFINITVITELTASILKLYVSPQDGSRYISPKRRYRDISHNPESENRRLHRRENLRTSDVTYEVTHYITVP